MNLTGIHFLLTYQCIYECDHCFVWSSPRAVGTMTLSQVLNVLEQAKQLGTVKSIYMEGGEPFLFYPITVDALRKADALGFRTGIVTNAYWATSVEDAVRWLHPLAQVGIADLSLSSDLYHGSSAMTETVLNAIEAADQLGIPTGVISIKVPEVCTAYAQMTDDDPDAGGPVRFRGRAAFQLTEGVARQPWTEFTSCPDEDLKEPGRVHVDAYGLVHVCQGLTIGDLGQRSLEEIVVEYDPLSHPVIGSLAQGGPVALVERYGLPHEEAYADACHLCYQARSALRNDFPECLGPDQVYGSL
jgi:hypothetical protein